MTPDIIRAARGLLYWTQTDLAAASGVSVASIRNYERGDSQMIAANLAMIAQAIAAAGVEILPPSSPDGRSGAGVRWRR